MRPLFPRWSNLLLWAALAGGIGTVVLVPTTLLAWAHSPYATGRRDPPVQPIKFDHRHHVRDDGIDCLYCHREATRSPHAGIPPTELCMGCHAQVWSDSPELEPLRRSAYAHEPIRWVRVSALPDFVRFDHRIHVAKGVGCVSCHGRVDQMAEVYAEEELTMSFCLGCHRDPDVHLRPAEAITDMELYPEGTPRNIGRQLRLDHDVAPRTDCTTCHR